MTNEFDHMTTAALQMLVTCQQNADRLTWSEQQQLSRAESTLRNRKATEIVESVGPFRSELAAKMYRETFMVSQRPHSVRLEAGLKEYGGGWYVETVRCPKVTTQAGA